MHNHLLSSHKHLLCCSSCGRSEKKSSPASACCFITLSCMRTLSLRRCLSSQSLSLSSSAVSPPCSLFVGTPPLVCCFINPHCKQLNLTRHSLLPFHPPLSVVVCVFVCMWVCECQGWGGESFHAVRHSYSAADGKKERDAN